MRHKTVKSLVFLLFLSMLSGCEKADESGGSTWDKMEWDNDDWSFNDKSFRAWSQDRFT